MSNNPTVSVLMPVYNADRYLKESIDSILNQTFTGFELLIINDGSTDKSKQIIEEHSDKRIRLISLKDNVGLVNALNIGLKEAKGEYIARMDADDISLPERLEYQVAYMNENPKVGVCGTWVEAFGEGINASWRYKGSDLEIRVELLFYCCLAHPSVILRSEFFKKYNLVYNPVPHVEDYDLWVRCAKYFKLANISKVLLRYRVHNSQVGKVFAEAQEQGARIIRGVQLKELGISASEEEIEIHEAIAKWRFSGGLTFTNKVESWFKKLIDTNNEKGKYQSKPFADTLSNKFYLVCSANANYGLNLFIMFYKSPFGKSEAISNTQRLKLLIKCLYNEIRRVLL